MLTIDGSGGGGQLLRTALSLSALTGQPFRMEGIREARPNPGLRSQHLAAVRALAAVTDAETADAVEGSTTLEFRPSAVQSGRYAVDVGTAGSITLVFDAVLPLAAALDGHLRLSVRGGTDVRWAPSLDYLLHVKLPLLRRSGLAAAVDVAARGFYPAGGGDAVLMLAPSSPDGLALASTGGRVAARAYSVASDGLADREVAERQLGAAVKGLDGLDVPVVERGVEYVASVSPGSALTLRLERSRTIAGVDALGERGKPAETVASEAVQAAERWLDEEAAVDAYLADQLLVFLGLAGGRVSVPAVTDHVRASLPLLEQFGYAVDLDARADPPVLSA